MTDVTNSTISFWSSINLGLTVVLGKSINVFVSILMLDILLIILNYFIQFFHGSSYQSTLYAFLIFDTSSCSASFSIPLIYNLILLMRLLFTEVVYILASYDKFAPRPARPNI